MMRPQRRWRSRLGDTLRRLASVLDPEPGDEAARHGADAGSAPEETAVGTPSDTWNFDTEDAPAHWVNRLRQAGLVRGGAGALGTRSTPAGSRQPSSRGGSDPNAGAAGLGAAGLGAGLGTAGFPTLDAAGFGAEEAASHRPAPVPPASAPSFRGRTPRSGATNLAASDAAQGAGSTEQIPSHDARWRENSPAVEHQERSGLRSWPADEAPHRRRLLVGQPPDWPGRQSGRESGQRPDEPVRGPSSRPPAEQASSSPDHASPPRGAHPEPGQEPRGNGGAPPSRLRAAAVGQVQDTVRPATGAARQWDPPAPEAARYPGRHDAEISAPTRRPGSADSAPPAPAPKPHPWPELHRDPVPAAPPVNPLAIARGIAREARLSDEQTAV